MGCNNCQLYSLHIAKFKLKETTKTYAVTRTEETVNVTMFRQGYSLFSSTNSIFAALSGIYFQLNFIFNIEKLMMKLQADCPFLGPFELIPHSIQYLVYQIFLILNIISPHYIKWRDNNYDFNQQLTKSCKLFQLFEWPLFVYSLLTFHV